MAAGTLLMLAGWGCASQEPGAATFSVRDSAGVRLLENTGPAWQNDFGWTVDSTPVFTLGAVNGPTELQFDGIVNVTRVHDGRIVVADRGSKEIRVFDPAGRLLIIMGREGRGPGEFQGIQGMALSGDTVIVLDGIEHRLTLFNASGTLIGTSRMQATGNPTGGLFQYRIAGLVAGNLVLVGRGYQPERGLMGTRWLSLPTLRYDLAGRLRDTSAEPAGGDLHMAPGRFRSITFNRYSAADVHNDLVYMTDGGTAEVRVYDVDVGLVRIVRAMRPLRQVTEAFAAEYVKAGAGSDPGKLADVREHFDSWPYAPTLPWLHNIIVDSEGYLWAEEYRHRFERGPAGWMVFDSQGKWLGTVPLPHGFTPHVIHDSEMIGVFRGDFGVEFIRSYSLMRSAR